MTNPSSGYKRSWDGLDSNSNKRGRGRDEPKDWRDVHLNSSKKSRTEDHRGRSSSGRSHHHSGRPESQKRNVRLTPPPVRDDSEREEGEISPIPSTTTSDDNKPTAKPPIPEEPALSQSPASAEPEVELELQIEPPSVEETLAARRAKRQAILAKYSSENPQALANGGGSAKESPSASANVPDLSSLTQAARIPIVEASVIGRGRSVSVSPTPTSFSLARNEGDDNAQASIQAQNEGEQQISAADYDPSLDRREDEKKRVRGPVPAESMVVDGDEEDEIEEEEEEVDDMFAVITEKKKIKKVKKKTKPVPALVTTNLDTASDPEGYYSVILGEQLDGGRYQVVSSLGKGMFANVVRARILQSDTGDSNQEVAIKIIRCQESMVRAGHKEAQLLNKLKQADPEDKKHIIRLERTFEHRGHLCLVFESMSMNLRDVVKRFGKDVGINIRAVRAYAHQLFLALSLLRKVNIMHADIKPDNILVNEQKTLLKLCDLGSASDASENDITPYLVSRFYRAPEIILGVPYDPALDVWSVGCTLFELYTGKILFPGRSNNQMLLLMMELKGRFNMKMIKKAQFGSVYFDEMGGFESIEKDRVTGSDVVKKVHISKATRDLRARLMPPASVKMSEDENKMLTSFIDLLDKCLTLDPARRLTPREALSHPFIRG